MKDYIVASFSGGKDSTAMVLRMIELGERLDEVICCDTGKEFPAMYRHIEKVRKVIEDAGIKFTMLRAERDFDYYAFEHQIKRRNPEMQERAGYGWPTPVVRWCTRELKLNVMDKHMRALSKRYNLVRCVGLAADEGYRFERPNNQASGLRHPLVEWGWTGADCLQYCYDRGYDWEGLYEIFGRVSCWCCPLKSLDEYRNLRRHCPDLWAELGEMDRRAWNQFLKNYSVEELEIRFALEDEREALGLTINGRTKEFREALAARLEEHRVGGSKA